MTVLTRYGDFRNYFAKHYTSSGSFTFVNSNPDTITRSSGSFADDQLLPGMVGDVTGTVNNNKRYHLAAVAASTLTLVASDAVTAEGPIATTIRAFWLANDGYEEFPGPFGHTNLVRSGGFTAGFTGVPHPYAGVSFQVTCNGGAADAALGVPDFHWYLSQRTDDSTKQLLTITEKAATITQSFSGSVNIVHSATGTTELGALTNPTMDQIVALFKHCHLYVRRNSDGAIQWVDLLKDMLQ